jgi:DnaJ-domain-containing protein 1
MNAFNDKKHSMKTAKQDLSTWCLSYDAVKRMIKHVGHSIALSRTLLHVLHPPGSDLTISTTRL